MSTTKYHSLYRIYLRIFWVTFVMKLIRIKALLEVHGTYIYA